MSTFLSSPAIETRSLPEGVGGARSPAWTRCWLNIRNCEQDLPADTIRFAMRCEDGTKVFPRKTSAVHTRITTGQTIEVSTSLPISQALMMVGRVDLVTISYTP